LVETTEDDYQAADCVGQRPSLLTHAHNTQNVVYDQWQSLCSGLFQEQGSLVSRPFHLPCPQSGH